MNHFEHFNMRKAKIMARGRKQDEKINIKFWQRKHARNKEDFLIFLTGNNMKRRPFTR
jgi:hypothetical protein